MTVAAQIETEVCVIGGGPAGATVARRLALLGHRVCLVESSEFPRRHIGESLAPGIIPLLEFLGLRETVEAAEFLRPTGALISWTDEPQFTETPGEPGFQVDRGRFDELLLAEAVQAGVSVLQPALAQSPQRTRSGWQIPVRCDGQCRNITASFVVDASGRRSLLAGRRQRDDAATIALYGYWNDTGIDDPTRVEAGSDEWFWGAALPDGTFNAAVFVDPQRCAEAGRAKLADCYRSMLKESKLLAPCLSGRLASQVLACDASRRFAVDPVGEDFIRVGEASFSIDPLSSQGVQAAMSSAQQASIVVHTILTQPQNAAVAMEFYTDRQTERISQDRATCSEFYRERASSCPQPFWQKRISQNALPRRFAPQTIPLTELTRVGWAADVQRLDVPVIHDDLIQSVCGLGHPMLDRPIAYLDGFQIDQLAGLLVRDQTVSQLLNVWSTRLPRAQACRILSWLWSRRLIVPVAESVCRETAAEYQPNLC